MLLLLFFIRHLLCLREHVSRKTYAKSPDTNALYSLFHNIVRERGRVRKRSPDAYFKASSSYPPSSPLGRYNMPPTTKTPITSILEGKESECGGYNDEGGGPPTLLSPTYTRFPPLSSFCANAYRRRRMTKVVAEGSLLSTQKQKGKQRCVN